MAISHADHDHPNTPAARAACRKALAVKPVPAPIPVKAPGDTPRLPGKAKVVRRNGTTPKAASGNLKRPGTTIKSIGDLADVPRMLAHGARLAWEMGWPVKVGDEFTGSKAKVVIDAPVCVITLVWSEVNPEGVHKIWVRHRKSSVWHQVNAIQAAIDAGETEDAWGAHGSYRGL